MAAKCGRNNGKKEAAWATRRKQPRQYGTEHFESARRRTIRAWVAAVLLTSGVSAFAASTDTWVGNTSVNFSSAANWTYSSGTGPVASGDSLVFNAGGSSGASLTDDLTAGTTFNSISFGTAASAYTIGGNSLDLGTSTAATSLTNTSTTAREAVNDNIILGNAVQTFSIAAGGMTLGGNVSGAGSSSGITISGGGTLTLSGANSYSGATTVSAGTLSITGSNSGGGSYSVNTGTLTINSNGTVTASSVTLSNGGSNVSVLNLNGGILLLGSFGIV